MWRQPHNNIQLIGRFAWIDAIVTIQFRIYTMKNLKGRAMKMPDKSEIAPNTIFSYTISYIHSEMAYKEEEGWHPRKIFIFTQFMYSIYSAINNWKCLVCRVARIIKSSFSAVYRPISTMCTISRALKWHTKNIYTPSHPNRMPSDKFQCHIPYHLSNHTYLYSVVSCFV